MMHKSYGNYVEVTEAINKYGADSVRQWAAAGGSTGYDIPYRWADVQHGRKFLTKLWNAARLILSSLGDYPPDLSAPKLELLDKWLLSKLNKLVKSTTDAFDNFQFNVATDSTRNFFWHDLCDQYLEAAKYRLYAEHAEPAESRRAAQFTLFRTLDVVLRLLAPICPHVADALYHELQKGRAKVENVHVAPWPTATDELIDEESEKQGTILVRVLSEIRRVKSERRVSMKAPIKRLRIHSVEEVASVVRAHLDAIRQIAIVQQVEVVPSKARTSKLPLEKGADFQLTAEF